jgi:hypothetical protein
MDFPGFDPARIARALALLDPGERDQVDAYFERLEEVEVQSGGPGPGLRCRRESGFAVRLEKPDQAWRVSADGVDADQLRAAYRRVARVMPPTPPVFDGIELPDWSTAPEASELLQFPDRLLVALRERRAALPLRLKLRRHRRQVQVIGPRLIATAEEEIFYSVAAELPGGRYGTLLADLDVAAAGALARALVEQFRARDAPPPEPGPRVLVLAPAAAAVLLHEVVAHTLEADNLALTGNPASAIGVELGSPLLSLLDDPGNAPARVRRQADDEGVPVRRRWLLRAGRVEEPLADRFWAERTGALQPGAARRGSRHQAPSPRSSHLELLPGGTPAADLITQAHGGLFVEEFARGRLDPLAGTFAVEASCARRIGTGGLGERVGRLRLRGRVADLLGAVTAVGDEGRSGGAGWCAKEGQRLPVWATACGLRLEGVEVEPA